MKGAFLALLTGAILVAIFCLTAQDVTETSLLSSAAERLLSTLVAPDAANEAGTPTWAGLTIRQLAHIAEFAALGLAAGFAVPFFARELSVRTWAGSVALCAVASFLDQVHKLYVPGRHFDGFDLVLDAGGYVVAVTVAHLVLTLTSKAPGHL